MLPEILSSSYKRYEEDTSVFTTWLSNAAQRCGYKPVTVDATLAAQQTPPTETKKAPRLKGKDRKLAKQAVVNGGKSP